MSAKFQSIILLALLSACVAAPDATSTDSSPTTTAPLSLQKVASSEAPKLLDVKLNVTSLPSVAPDAATTNQSVTSLSTKASNVSVTLMPQSDSTKEPEAPSKLESKLVKNSGACENGTLSKFCQYLNPICETIDEISPKQLFRVQAQFKQLVAKTDGKLAFCFLEHYKIEPNLAPVTKEQLKVICSSRGSDPKSSYRLFESCASRNWDSAVDIELDRIIAARLDCAVNHQHPKNNSNSALLLHEDDDKTFMSDVVRQVFKDDKNLANNSDVRLIDLSKRANNGSGTLVSDEATKGLINDPNTVLVFVDDAKSTKAPVVATIATTMSKPLTQEITSRPKSEEKTSTSSPNLGDLIAKKLLAEVSSIEDPLEVVAQSNSSHKHPSSTTKSPIKAVAPTTVKALESVLKTTLKPWATLQEILKRQEKEKKEFDAKLKLERDKVLKLMTKKQDAIDAQNAIKALQYQRDANGHKTDSRLHQLEHHRQMSIDPIGHTIKHQQYELSKQRLMVG